MPSLITICVVERERDQKRIKRKSLRHPLQERMMNQVVEESSDDDSKSQWSEIDEAPIFFPRLLTRWSIDKDESSKPTFQYIVQSPSTESTSTNCLWRNRLLLIFTLIAKFKLLHIASYHCITYYNDSLIHCLGSSLFSAFPVEG